MKLRFISLLGLTALLAAFPAYALDLHDARRQGVVGEKLDGFAAALKSAPDVNNLVASVNAKRQQEYARISKQNGQPPDVVGKLAAQQIINNLPPGTRYQSPDGSWKVK